LQSADTKTRNAYLKKHEKNLTSEYNKKVEVEFERARKFGGDDKVHDIS
jgi:hypothetical protein